MLKFMKTTSAHHRACTEIGAYHNWRMYHPDGYPGHSPPHSLVIAPWVGA